MLDIGWSELLLIGVVVLIVVGPRDLPVMFRTLGRFTAKARSMTRDLQRAMDEAAKASGVHETLKDVRSMTSKKSLGIDALESAAAKFEKWNPTLPGKKVTAKTPETKADGTTADVAKTVSAAADKTAADAIPTIDTSNMGPATKALAEKVARTRQERLSKKASSDTSADSKPAEPAVQTEVTPKASKARAARQAVKPAAPAKAMKADPAPRGASKAKAKAGGAPVLEAAAASAPKVASPRKPRNKKTEV